MATNLQSTLPSPQVHPTLKRDLLAAVLTGQVAGLIMAVAMIAVFVLFLGKPWYFPVQVIGSMALGDQALPGTFFLPAFLAGLALHQLAATVLWSVVFGFVIHNVHQTTINLLAVGLGVGAFSQMVDVSFVVPVLMNRLHGHNIWAENVPNMWSWIAHLVFGACFVLFLSVRKQLPRSV